MQEHEVNELVDVNTNNINTLKKQSTEIVTQILEEENVDKIKDLTELFNINQNKKSMLRVNKLNELLDIVVDQAITRFSTHPDEISNKELLDSLKVAQDTLERNQKQINSVPDTPLIQINQQNNELNLGEASTLDRESRDRVKQAVMSLLQNINMKQEVEEEQSSEYLTEDEE